MNLNDVARWKLGDVIVYRLVETPLTARIVHAYMGNPAPSQGTPFLADGKILTVLARPYVVIADTDESLILLQPERTPFARWHQIERREVEARGTQGGYTLRFLFPGVGFDVTLFFEGTGPLPPIFESLFGDRGLHAGWRSTDRATASWTGAPAAEPILGVPGRFRGWYVNMQTPFWRRPYGVDVADMALDIVVRPDYSWYWKDEDELATAVSAGACTEAEAATIRDWGLEALRMMEAREGPFDPKWTTWRPDQPYSITREQIPDGWQDAPALIAE